MALIRDVVQQSLDTGYLTLDAEEQLRQLLQIKNSQEDLKAFIALQQAVMEGLVIQQRRVQHHQTRSANQLRYA